MGKAEAFVNVVFHHYESHSPIIRILISLAAYPKHLRSRRRPILLYDMLLPSAWLCLVASVAARSLFDFRLVPFDKGGDQKPIAPPKHGLEIPKIGLGLWNSKAKLATDAVESAFVAGYHHFDSAA